MDEPKSCRPKRKKPVTLGSKGQVVIPKALRDKHGFTTETLLIAEDDPRGVLIRRSKD